MPDEDIKDLDDETLIRLVALQQTDAFRELYERYSPYVFGLAVYITGDRGAAEEITQDVFLRLWQRAGSYRIEQARLKTWLLSIARNRSIDILRRRKVRPEQTSVSIESVIFEVVDPANVERDVDQLLKREQIRTALLELPPEQRKVIVLAYYYGYSQSQIAAIQGAPIGTIKTRTRLAMQKLRQSLDRTENET